MQTAQRIIRRYRQRRLILSCASALVVLLMTLAVSYLLARAQNTQRLDDFSRRAVSALDTLLSHADRALPALRPLAGAPCNQVQQMLRTTDSQLQTLRSIGLVDKGAIYCTSVYGEHNIPLHTFSPLLPSPHPQLLIVKAQTLLKGTPILMRWSPADASGQRGVTLALNIDLLAGLILIPEPPWVTHTELYVSGAHLSYGLPDTMMARPIMTLASTNFPYQIKLMGPTPSWLALKSMPSQLPLAFLLSMAVGYLTWLASANRMSFNREISEGISMREFRLFCQPLIASLSQTCVGVEILLRWDNPRQGWLAPDLFITLAEENAMIVPLTRYLLRELGQNRHLFPASLDFHIGINVAPEHFNGQNIIHDLSREWFALAPAQQLVLELTERQNLQHIPTETFRALQQCGVKLAIDDFGTGQTSLSWLERLRPNILKIDKTFINAIGRNAVNSQVVDIIIALSQRLAIALIAEGVETESQASWLRVRGVETLQGFLYARPMPIEQFPQWLDTWQDECAGDDPAHPIITLH